MFECPAIRASVHASQPLSPRRVRNVPDRIDLECTKLGHFESLLVLNLEAVMVDVAVLGCRGPNPAL